MSTKRVVHVVGTGTLGEPLISLLLNLQRDLEFDELTFHKNRPLLDDRVKILTLMRRGAKLAEARSDWTGPGARRTGWRHLTGVDAATVRRSLPAPVVW